MNWIYKQQEIRSIEDIPLGVVGFIYCIKFKGNDGNHYSYYGRKILHFKKRVKPSKKSGKKRCTIKRVESDWLTYESSSNNVENLLNEGKLEILNKQIIMYSQSKSDLNYQQTKILFSKGVLQDKNSLNESILGKYFSKVEKQWRKLI